jgi:hypothetical protein
MPRLRVASGLAIPAFFAAMVLAVAAGAGGASSTSTSGASRASENTRSGPPSGPALAKLRRDGSRPAAPGQGGPERGPGESS